jgi:hypothetical protein
VAKVDGTLISSQFSLNSRIDETVFDAAGFLEIEPEVIRCNGQQEWLFRYPTCNWSHNRANFVTSTARDNDTRGETGH